MTWLFRPVCFCLIAISAVAWQTTDREARRLYVEPFATKAGGKLREDVAAEVRKLRSITVVSRESSADLTIGGGGEIWIKGYRSLDPRSGRSPSNGMPVYSGYLSVELKDKSGVTRWSYLVTPAADSTDVSRDLARRIAKHLAEGLAQVDPPTMPETPPQPAIILKAAGATFPFPVYSKWFSNYRHANPGVQIDYDPVGSEAGIRKLLAGSVDFGASDNPEALHALVPAEEHNYLLFPSTVGAVVPIVNLPGLPHDIAFTPEALVGIFLGKITRWDDPLLAQANRGIRLPALDITVVHRSDGSGTSYAFSDYLSRVSPERKSKAGLPLSPRWPAGRAAEGNEGVASLVKELGGSIGYVEFIYALEHHLSYGRVRNRNGEFVAAGLESIAAAVTGEVEMRDDLKASIVDAPGRGAYSIASFTWLVVPAHIADSAKRTAVTAFLRWMIGPGRRQSAALGYLPLPKDVVAKESQAIAKIH